MYYPYYRYSTHVDSIDKLDEWFKHFMKIKKACCVVRQSRQYGKTQTFFSLWVIGQESGADGNTEEIAGEVVRLYDPRKDFIQAGVIVSQFCERF